MQLIKREARQIVALLRELQTNLKCTIDSMIVPGTGEPDPRCPMECREVAVARKQLQHAEKLIGRLTK
jgi:hypothetical protein